MPVDADGGLTSRDHLEVIRALMRLRDDFVITGHVNPDADAVGSCYGLALALMKMGKRCRVVLDAYSSKMDIIPGQYLRYTGPLDTLNPQVFFCLDCGDVNRLGAARLLLDKAGETVCVDHHATNTGFARHNYLDGDASSASELVYRLIHTEVDLDREIASALYAGMIMDTGGFRYSATTRETLHVAGELVALGIPFTDIYTELYHQHTYTELKLRGRVLMDCVRCCGDRVIYACVTQAMMREINASWHDLEGVVEYLLNTKGAAVSILFSEREGTEVKASFRSTRIDVGKIAYKLGGGGHMMAAGCNLRRNI